MAIRHKRRKIRPALPILNARHTPHDSPSDCVLVLATGRQRAGCRARAMILPRLPFVPRLGLPPLTAIVVGYVVGFLPLLLILYFHEKRRRAQALEPRGCRKLGMPVGLSNLSDQYSYGVDGMRMDTPATGKEKIRIKALMTYPIKSCKGVELPSSKVEKTGLAYDRIFCFAEYFEQMESIRGETIPAHWVARTMRDAKFRKMALITPEIWVADPASPSYSARLPAVASQGVLIIRYPREVDRTEGWRNRLLWLAIKIGLAEAEERFEVPLYPPSDHTYQLATLRIWNDAPEALDYGRHVPASLSKYLGASKRLSLLRINPSGLRTVTRCAPSEEQLGRKTETALADVYPLNLMNISSVRFIAKRVAANIPRLSVLRYRPNILIEGVPAFAEDDWKRLAVIPRRVTDSTRRADAEAENKPDGTQHKSHSPCHSTTDDGSTVIYVASRTPRCRLPNVDPETGVRHPVEPDKAMRSFRCIDPGHPTKACLGMQMVAAREAEFELHIGDEVRVLETGKHHYQ
ncbi:hypothetical protein KEM52_006076 [Ascosphaera acerosa]|nr:hypothetical protein KEM52_006076 [Ascosphaera acerosa]